MRLSKIREVISGYPAMPEFFKINPVTKDHFRQFTINDGLQGNQFIARSSLKSSEGKLYFGGINGFNVFQPEQFVDNKYIPPVYVTDIRLPYQTMSRR